MIGFEDEEGVLWTINKALNTPYTSFKLACGL